MTSLGNPAALAEKIADLSESQRAVFISRLPPGTADRVKEILTAYATEQAQEGTALELLPHQRIPDPHMIDRGHVFAGGRGAGKTLALANYGARIAESIPNLRMRVIAPTLSDAVNATALDPQSGILAHSPSATFRPSGVEGARITWPNGSVCYLVGTPTLKEVDRLRALTNIDCVAAETPILLADGSEKPVQDIIPGDLVQTREGPRRVVATRKTEPKRLYRLETEQGRILHATADHRVAVPGGSLWANMDVLEDGQEVTAWEVESSATGRPATDHVRQLSRTDRVEPTHDLTVEDCPEFIAGGIVVHNCDLIEEAAANPRLTEAMAQANLSRRGNRLDHPIWIAATTPRAVPEYRKWLEDSRVSVTRATTLDNPHTPDFYREYAESLKGTHLYEQEILGNVLDDVQGALWTRGNVDKSVITDTAAQQALLATLSKTIVAVDPPSGHGTCGIVVVGVTQAANDPTGRPRIVVLDDFSIASASPSQWGNRVIDAATAYEAPILAERNQGGLMVQSTIEEAASSRGIDFAPITLAHAKVSKERRAAPVALLWEVSPQRAIIAPPEGNLARVAELIDELTSWTPGAFSPDRLDACIARGQLVLTTRGQVPIEDVTTSDSVWTRVGWRPVEATRMTRPDAETLDIQLSTGEVLTCTPDHRILLDSGEWVEAAAVTSGDRLNAWSTGFHPAPVAAHVVRSSPGARADVFDLQIGGQHEFVASGVIVHNCVWGALHLMDGGSSATATLQRPSPNTTNRTGRKSLAGSFRSALMGRR